MVHANGKQASPRILVILGSVRDGRVCPGIAEWLIGIGREAMTGEFEVVDLRQWKLPMDDEPGIPAAGVYCNGHTQAWSKKISGSDAVVFVTPQYNWGYPAPLKNALDHLYEEWRGKPAMIVTYGGHGGSKCARQLRQVAKGLHMKLARTMPSLTIPRGLIEANDGSLVPERQFAGRAAQVRRAFSDLAGLVA